MTAIYAVLVRRDWRTVVLALPAGAAFAWVLAEYVFLIPARQAFVSLTPLAPSRTADLAPFLRVLMFLLYGFAPLAVLLVLIGQGLFGGRGRTPNGPPKKTKGKEKYVAAGRKRPSLAVFARLALSALPIVLMALGLYLGGDALRKPYVLSNYYSCQKRWDKVLELAAACPKAETTSTSITTSPGPCITRAGSPTTCSATPRTRKRSC